MMSTSRRIRRLEDRLGPPVETPFLRRLCERLEAARRRFAKAEGREYGDPAPDTMRRESENLSGLTVTQILHRGRARTRAQSERFSGTATYDEAGPREALRAAR